MKELDTLIAEKVMGWHLKTKDGLTYWADEDGYIEAYEYWEHHGSQNDPWSPSTDMNDALRVLEKLRKESIAVVMDNGAEEWTLFAYKVNGKHEYTDSVYNKPAPEAICLLALKVKKC